MVFFKGTNLELILSDKDENTTTADSDFSYHPTPQRTTRKRHSRLFFITNAVKLYKFAFFCGFSTLN